MSPSDSLFVDPPRRIQDVFRVLKHRDSIHKATLEENAGAISIMQARNDTFCVVLSIGCKATRHIERPKFMRTIPPDESFGLRGIRSCAHLRDSNEAQSDYDASLC
jgi:hypothetical protein